MAERIGRNRIAAASALVLFATALFVAPTLVSSQPGGNDVFVVHSTAPQVLQGAAQLRPLPHNLLARGVAVGVAAAWAVAAIGVWRRWSQTCLGHRNVTRFAWRRRGPPATTTS